MVEERHQLEEEVLEIHTDEGGEFEQSEFSAC